jgi:glucose-6-phosphate 1-dehydrogenase
MRYLLLGATGDLARRKIVPALARLFAQGALPRDFELVASSRRPWKDAEYRAFVAPGLGESFLARVRYLPADFAEPDSLRRLREAASRADALQLAIAPTEYERIIESLGDSLRKTRLLIEKPFGVDEASARSLDALITRFMPEERVFRVDHYLGKPGVRMLADAARGAGRVELYLEERRDLNGRGAFYDPVGILRDVVQNHALEVLAVALCANDRAAALRALGYIEGSLRLGQYEGYTSEPGVAEGSLTPTAVRLALRYRDTRIAIHAGKALREDRNLIVIDGVEYPLASDHDYEHLVADALAARRAWFPALPEILAAWRLIDPLVRASATPALYAPGTGDF